MIKPAIALCISLAVPSAAVFADDELTEELHGNSYQEAATVYCDAFVCYLTFPPTQHINTVITNVNCSFRVDFGGQVSSAALFTKNSAQYVNMPVYFLGNQGSAFTALGINTQVNFFIAKGDTPKFGVELFSGTISNLQCLISGYHS